MKKNKYAIVVLSHSTYSDLWPILIESYSRFFEDDRFDRYICTDGSEDLVGSSFQPIIYSKNITWGTALKCILRELDYERVIITFDDLILNKKVNVEALIKYIENSQSDYSKLICSHVRFYERALMFGKDFNLSKQDSYRGSLVFASINRKFCKFLINAEIGEYSPWKYEREINKKIPSEMILKGIRKNIFCFKNLVIKSKVDPLVYLYLKSKGLSYNGGRSFMSLLDFIVYYTKLPIFTFIKYLIPYKLFSLFRKGKEKIVRPL